MDGAVSDESESNLANGGSQSLVGNDASNGSTQIFGNTNSTISVYLSNQPYEKPPTEIFDAPDLLSQHFTGRVAELADIRQELSKATTETPTRYVIYGMPGVGKTQLALKYANSAYRDKQFQYIFWISGSSIEKISHGFAKLLDLVCYPGRASMDQIAKLTAVTAWLEGRTGATTSWLVVVDNTDPGALEILRDVLPTNGRHGAILITTRARATAKALAVTSGVEHKVAELKPPGIEDAVDMLFKSGIKRALDSDSDSDRREPAKRVVLSVGCLPLAVEQAASFMEESGCGTSELLSIYNSEDVTDIMDWENTLSLHEERSVSATFALAFEQLEKMLPAAANLLRVLSFLDPENISVDMLSKGRKALQQDTTEGVITDASQGLLRLLQSRVALQKAIQQLQTLSLAVSKSENGMQSLWIHDLVHLLIRVKFTSAADRAAWLELAISIASEAFEQIGDRRAPENWPRCESFVTHFRCLSEHAETLRVNSVSLLDSSHWVASYFFAAGRYEEEEALEIVLVERRKKLLGLEDPDTLTSMANLALTYSNRGRWDEAEALGVEVMETRKRVLGPEHPNILTSMGNLALTYSTRGRWDEAEALEVEVMETRKRVLGPEHPDTLTSMANLAMTYRNLKRWDEAEALGVKVMGTRKRVLGPEHPNTLTSMANLALTYSNRRRWDEAEALGVEVMGTRKRVLGPEHPDTVTSMGNLALTYSNSGRWDEAEALGVEVMGTRKRVLGPEHPDTLTSMANLAATYWNLKRLAEAEQLEAKVLETRSTVLGKEHPNTLRAMDNLAHTWKSLGRDDDAFRLMTNAFNGREKILGSNHPDTISSRETLDVWLDKS